MAQIFRRYFLYLDRRFRKIQEFHQYLNSFHPTIKFTKEFSNEQISLLDVNISQKMKVPYKQTYIVRRHILTSSYILDLVIIMFTKSQSRIDRLFKSKEFVLIKKNYLCDLRIQKIVFVVGVVRQKYFIVRSKKFNP